MSKLVVDLTNSESVALARQVLESVGNDWPSPTTSNASANLPPGTAGGSVSASASGSQIDSKADDYDPWATSAPSPDTPPAAGSGLSSGKPSGQHDPAAPFEASSADTDDDNPWS